MLGAEAFLYKLLFNKACNDGQNASIDELRKNLEGNRVLSTDLADDLLAYLDNELPKASSDETERVMEDAAPLLAALLVPLKKKYDQISVIKDEVTEAITEVIPVEEMMEEYEVTVEDLRSFCRKLGEEVDEGIEAELDELHARIWELDDDNYSNFDGYSDYSYSGYSSRRSSVDLTNFAPPPGLPRQISLELPGLMSSDICDGISYDQARSNDRILKRENSNEQVIRSSCQILLGSAGSEEDISNQEGITFPKGILRRQFSTEREFHDLPQFLQPDISVTPAWSRSSSPRIYLSAKNSRRNSLSSETIARHLNIPDNHLFQQECPDKKQDADESIVEKRHTRLSILIDYVRYQIHGDEVFTVEPEVPN